MFKSEDRLLAVLNWIHIVLLLETFYLVISSLGLAPSISGPAFSWGGIVLFIPLAASYVMLRKIHGFPVYFAAAALITAAILVVTKNPFTVFFTILIFYVRASTRVKRARILADIPAIEDMRGEKVELELWDIPTILDSPSFAQFTLYGIGYLVIIFVGDLGFLKHLFTVFLIDCFVVLALMSTGNMKQFLIKNRGIANIPIKTVRRMQRMIMVFVLAALALFVLPSVIYGREPLALLRNLSLKLTQKVGIPAPEISMGNFDDLAGRLSEYMGGKSGEMPVWLKVGLNIVIYGICAAVLIALCRTLLKMFKGMMKSFREGEQDDEITFIGAAEGDENYFTARRRQRRDARTPSGKIRKAYRKLIKKKLKTSLSGSETPTELEEKAALTTARQAIHDLYEKARYGSEDCTSDELKEFEKQISEVR